MSVSCSYDAPDLPAGGGHFARTLTLDASSSDIAIEERFAPSDPASTARLESVSGFAYRAGDVVIAPDTANYVGFLHGRRLAALRWQPGDVEHATVKHVRGAQLLTLVFTRRDVNLRLGIYDVNDAAEAERLLQANPP